MRYICLSAITCISLGAPTNGEVTYSSGTTSPFNYGTVATFTCNTGFGLIGNMTRTCEGDGSSPVGLWSEVTPTCVGEIGQQCFSHRK